jgi:ATP-binding protein involved in chromosome partitioning
MATVDKEAVLERLRGIRGPDDDRDIVRRGMVSDVLVTDGRVMFSITVPAERAKAFEPMRSAAETAVKTMPGVESVMVALTAERQSGGAQGLPTGARPGPAARPGGPGGAGGGPGGPAQPPAGGQSQSAAGKIGVAGVANIVAVASGKGGVGKSTTAVNLALAMKANGLRVGLLDADIYGPSLPRLLGLTGKPETTGGRMLKPLVGYGVPVMSMGFLVEEDTPMIWRGPMVVSALSQMLREVAWGELDVLVVDMPPGTGDAQLTMAQQVPLAGAVIVSTPQDLALIDARKGLNMFRRVDVPVLGLVENMSYYLCPNCGDRSEIFAHGGARREAEKLGVPLLAEVPLDIRVRETSDEGTPIVVAEPDNPLALIYRDMARAAWSAIEAPDSRGAKAPPRIVIE